MKKDVTPTLTHLQENVWDKTDFPDSEGTYFLVLENVLIRRFGKITKSYYQRRNILVYNSKMMHKSQTLFNLATALHVSGVTITHLQEHKTTVATASDNRYTVLLSAAIMEELEPV
jgi:hypothetical protein